MQKIIKKIRWKNPRLPSALDAVRTEQAVTLMVHFFRPKENNFKTHVAKLNKNLQSLTWAQSESSAEANSWFFDKSIEASSYRRTWKLNKGRKPSGHLVEPNISRSANSTIGKDHGIGLFSISKHPQTHQMNTSRNLENHHINIILWEGKGVKKEPWRMYVSVCRYKKWINKT